MCYNLKCSGWELLKFLVLKFAHDLFVGFIQSPSSLLSPHRREEGQQKYQATSSAPCFFFGEMECKND